MVWCVLVTMVTGQGRLWGEGREGPATAEEGGATRFAQGAGETVRRGGVIRGRASAQRGDDAAFNSARSVEATAREGDE